MCGGFMTDEKFIEWLRKVKEYCKSYRICEGCKFHITDKQGSVDCHFKKLAFHLWRNTPNNWDMEEIERIIRL